MTHNRNQIIEELKNLEKVVLYGVNSSDHKSVFTKFSPIFPCATENIKGYLNEFDIEGADVLVPCASGDHALEALSKGANSIDMYDINAYAYHMARLKFAAVKTLSKEEFLDFFAYYNDDHSINKKAWNFQTYLKVRKELPQYSRNFFDIVMKLSKENFSLTSTNLVVKSFRTKDETIDLLDYLKDDNFDALKEKMIKLDEKNIEYFNANIIDLPRFDISKQYDLILLSNIQDYLGSVYPDDYTSDLLKKYRDFVRNDLSKLLKDDGSIVSEYRYFYGTLSFLNADSDQKFIKVPCVFTDSKSNDDKHYDSVYIYQKK